ncbi:27717_t:CDS:2 [Dentiscutata erythropus]|uniref:27717_t:CDS:1 n=1 Tax=Dentiscutata erythropus TaxID=1348616 RepID=A0A9N9FF50_9GLOM|nr:27717_t:CDS:2 [Dentiscutata erythropus]
MSQVTNIQPQNNQRQRLSNVGISQRTQRIRRSQRLSNIAQRIQRTQHDVNLFINTALVQRYNELVEGASLFDGLRGPGIQLQNAESQTEMFFGLSFT